MLSEAWEPGAPKQGEQPGEQPSPWALGGLLSARGYADVADILEVHGFRVLEVLACRSRMSMVITNPYYGTDSPLINYP